MEKLSGHAKEMVYYAMLRQVLIQFYQKMWPGLIASNKGGNFRVDSISESIKHREPSSRVSGLGLLQKAGGRLSTEED